RSLPALRGRGRSREVLREDQGDPRWAKAEACPRVSAQAGKVRALHGRRPGLLPGQGRRDVGSVGNPGGGVVPKGVGGCHPQVTLVDQHLTRIARAAGNLGGPSYVCRGNSFNLAPSKERAAMRIARLTVVGLVAVLWGIVSVGPTGAWEP